MMGAFVAIAMLMAGATTAYADLCKNVRFKYTNRTKNEIKITKVMYWDKSDQKWRTENMPAWNWCDPGATCTTHAQDLEHVENEVIEKIRFVYSELRKRELG